MTKFNSLPCNPNLIEFMKEKLEGHKSGRDLSALKKERKIWHIFADRKKTTIGEEW